MRTESEYYIERLNYDKLADVARLHHAVYNKVMPLSFFTRKYDTAFTGVEYTGYLAYNPQGIPVAYYGVVPCFLQDGDITLLAAQSADTMTHPQYRYKGLFVELSNMTFDLCKQNNIRIVFGFPNQHSLHGAIHKLGWQMTHTMDCFTIPVRAMPLQKITGDRFLLKDMYRLYKRWILKRYSSPWTVGNSVIQDGYAGVYRDAGYWEYKKYYDREVIQAGDTLIWIKTGDGLIIGDMTLGADIGDVIGTLRKLAARLGLRQLQFHTSPGTSVHSELIKRWQPLPSFPVLFQDFGSGWDLDRIRFNFGDIDIF